MTARERPGRAEKKKDTVRARIGVAPLRLAYSGPAILWEEAFEVRNLLSFACGKTNPGDPQCISAFGPS